MNSPIKNSGSLSKLDSQGSTRNKSYVRSHENKNNRTQNNI